MRRTTLTCSAFMACSLSATAFAQDTIPPAPRVTHQLPTLSVIGERVRLRTIPGAAVLLDASDLRVMQPRNLNDALRSAPGVFVRDEEGLGLRPNIGIRGLNPVRSTAVLLLEDGVPFSLAPYGDNGSYYAPPIDRFSGVEILKGSGQIAYGPRTIGGVINLLSPRLPTTGHEGRVALAGGNRNYRQAHVRYGVGVPGRGMLTDLLYRRAGSGREHVGTTIADGTLKAELAFAGTQTFTIKGNHYRERSQVTYSGLTEAEYADDPFQNPFVNDSMFMERSSLMASHRIVLGAGAVVTTRAYGSWLSRDWWRQSSNSAERPNDASDPACGGMANLTTTCGNQGRLRDYRIFGVEPRVLVELPGPGQATRLEAGLRFHVERQDRRQENGDGPLARAAGSGANAGVVESNLRRNAALAAFVQPAVEFGDWTVTPGLRLEHVNYERVNRLADGTPMATTSLTRLIPGVGVNWRPAERATLFAGIHRGFAPPRTEDMLTNAGGVVDLEAEESWNSELGARYAARAGFQAEVTLFQLDFANQIVPASVAGGSGATLTSAGETMHRGLELSARVGSEAFSDSPHRTWLQASWTWVAVARYDGERYAWIGTGDGDVAGKVYLAPNAADTRPRVSVTGNRLPYAPEHLLAVAVGYDWATILGARLEAAHTSAQFADPVNTSVTVADGQQGPIAASTVWNLTADYLLGPARTRLSVGVRNLFDTRYVTDRSRGLMPGMPRTVQVGVTTSF